MGSTQAGTFTVGSWSVDPELDRIEQAGQVVTLRPQVMEVLVYLAAQDGRVVSLAELHENIWAGRIVTNGSLYTLIAELRQALGSGPDEGLYIETIPKKGYRLTMPVSWPGIEANGPQPSPSTRATFNLPLSRIFVVGVALALAALMLAWWWPDTVEEPAVTTDVQALPRLVVLPFQNLSNDPENEYFSDGVSGEILNALSASPGLQVIARTSAFALKGRELSIREIADELDVDYVVEGAVGRDGDRLRITWQLVRTADGINVQGQALDRRLDDIFSLQQEIAANIAAALGRSLSPGEPPSLTRLTSAYDYYLRAMQQQRLATQESLDRAGELFQAAIELDPDFIKARNGLARNYLSQMVHRSYESGELLQKAMEQVRESLARQPGNANAHGLRLQVQFYRAGREGRAGSAKETADALAAHVLREGSDPYVHSVVSYWLIEYFGEQEQGLRLLEHGLESDPLNNDLLWTLAAYHYHAGDLEESKALLLDISQRTPEYWWAYESLSKIAFDEGDVVGSLYWARRALEADPGHALMEALIAVRLFEFGFMDAGEHWLTRLRANPSAGALLDVAEFYQVVAQADCRRIAEAARGLLEETHPGERNADYLGDIMPHYAHCMAVLGRVEEALEWLESEYPNTRTYHAADFSENDTIAAQDLSLQLAYLVEDRAATLTNLQRWFSSVEQSGWRIPPADRAMIELRLALLAGDLPGAEKVFAERLSHLNPTHRVWTALSHYPWYAELRARDAVAQRLDDIRAVRDGLRSQVEEMLQRGEWKLPAAE